MEALLTGLMEYRTTNLARGSENDDSKLTIATWLRQTSKLPITNISSTFDWISTSMDPRTTASWK